MEIKLDLAKEIKAESEIIYNLCKKINTGGTHENNTEYVKGESLEASRYIVEVDRYDNPFKYYHCQILKYHCEIRKGKKTFDVHCFNFNPEIKIDMYNKKTNKNYGGNLHNIFICDSLEESQLCYEECVIKMIEQIKGIRENLLIW